MKKAFIVIFIIIACQASFAQKLKEPSEGKSLVYFTRATSIGWAINFKFFDGEKYLGKFNGEYYMVYECDPGVHSFWANSENYSMVYAELDSGRVYIINAKAKMGAWKTNVELVPLDKKDKKYQKNHDRIMTFISNYEEVSFTEEELLEHQEKGSFSKMKEKGLRYVEILNMHQVEKSIITPDMYIELYPKKN